jgi:hypothetical protein
MLTYLEMGVLTDALACCAAAERVGICTTNELGPVRLQNLARSVRSVRAGESRDENVRPHLGPRFHKRVLDVLQGHSQESC